MIRFMSIAGALTAAAAFEAALIHSIDFRSPGGSAQPAEADFYSLIWAATPLSWGFLVIVAAAIWHRPLKRALLPLLFLSAVGPVFAYFALVQYDFGSSEQSLIVGFLLQCAGALVATLLVILPPNPALENGRAASGAPAQRER
jgi:hypothetical protein